MMKGLVLFGFLVSVSLPLFAQDREVPKDSTRISIPGCARGRVFTVAPPIEDEPLRSDVAPGRRFRLAGQKSMLDEIAKREGAMLEVTGLVRKAQLSGQGGIPIAGGRIRIGGGVPQSPTSTDPRRDPGFNQAVIDVESWRPLPESCPAR
jgi:hypothetical protein